jgi:hypothetical protein
VYHQEQLDTLSIEKKVALTEAVTLRLGTLATADDVNEKEYV